MKFFMHYIVVKIVSLFWLRCAVHDVSRVKASDVSDCVRFLAFCLYEVLWVLLVCTLGL